MPTPPAPRAPTRTRRPATALAAASAAVLLALTGCTAGSDDGESPSTSTSAEPEEPGATGGPAACEGESAGPLRVDGEFEGESTGLAVPYSVSLPADYYTACEEYPVVYTLHGKGDSSESFLEDAEAVRAAMEEGVLDDAVIVTPDGFGDGRWEGDGEDNFLTELVPYVEENYRVLEGPSHRLLTGFSMGGHGAFRFAVMHPEMWAGVYSVDGAMARDPEDYLRHLDQVRETPPRMVTVGGQLNGERVEEVIDAFADEGVEIPYTYYDVEHSYPLFIEADRDDGWPAMRFLDAQLGRPL